MGRNNQQRRREKKRKQKKSRASTTSGVANHKIRPEYVYPLCDFVDQALCNGEPPPPGLRSEILAASRQIAPIADLVRVADSFLDYCFGETQPADVPSGVMPRYRDAMLSCGFSEQYTILSVYSLLASDIACSESPVAFEEQLAPYLERAIGNCHECGTTLQAPFDLFADVRFAASVPKHSTKATYRRTLAPWLRHSPVASLTTPLAGFLALKKPNAKQQGVRSLENSLDAIDWSDLSWRWRGAIAGLLQHALHSRLSDKARIDLCTKAPALGRIVACSGLGASPDTLTRVHKTDLSLGFLRGIESKLNLQALPYQERVFLASLQCRVAAIELEKCNTLAERRPFTRALLALLAMLTTGIPPGSQLFAQQCLDGVGAWLVNTVVREHTPLPTSRALKVAARARPNDFRFLLLYFVASGTTLEGKSAGGDAASSQCFSHVDFELFYYTFSEKWNECGPRFLEHFYSELAVETKRELILQTCRRLFLSPTDEDTRDEVWQRVLRHLMAPRVEPVASVVAGRPAAVEFCFYSLVAAFETDCKGIEPTAERVIAVLGFAAKLMEDCDFFACKRCESLIVGLGARALFAPPVIRAGGLRLLAAVLDQTHGNTREIGALMREGIRRLGELPDDTSIPGLNELSDLSRRFGYKLTPLLKARKAAKTSTGAGPVPKAHDPAHGDQVEFSFDESERP